MLYRCLNQDRLIHLGYEARMGKTRFCLSVPSTFKTLLVSSRGTPREWWSRDFCFLSRKQTKAKKFCHLCLRCFWTVFVNGVDKFRCPDQIVLPPTPPRNVYPVNFAVEETVSCLPIIQLINLMPSYICNFSDYSQRRVAYPRLCRRFKNRVSCLQITLLQTGKSVF